MEDRKMKNGADVRLLDVGTHLTLPDSLAKRKIELDIPPNIHRKSVFPRRFKAQTPRSLDS
jgi:hypothetical protein